MRRRLACFSLVVAIAKAGCSWVLVETPPAADPAPGEPLSCTDSNFIPAADFVAAGGSAFASLIAFTVALALSINNDAGAEPAAYLGLAGLGASGLFLWSGIDGALDTSRCRELEMRRAVPPPGGVLR